MKFKFSVLLGLLLSLSYLHGQDYEPGVSYFDDNDYIEYIHGNLPIILSSPHGGYDTPDEIPDRECSNCVYIRDAFTQELTREIAENIYVQTGCHPYVVINKLHRVKLDANRSIITGADGDPLGQQAWMDYHGYIEYAQAEIEMNIGAGLFLDIHGHAHDIQRLELGYLLSEADLKLEPEELNLASLVDKSSIAHLVNDNKMNLTHSELLSGDFSFGTLIDGGNYPAVPSFDDPFPDDNPYFTGGYNTVNYGSRDGGLIDGIQIECNQDVRFFEQARKRFAEDMATTILEFMEVHYEGFDLCQMTSVVEKEAFSFELFPVPCIDELSFSSDDQVQFISIYNSMGEQVLTELSHHKTTTLDLSLLAPGSYFFSAKNKDGIEVRRAFVKM